MRVVQLSEVGQEVFFERVKPVLLQNEAMNNVMLGILARTTPPIEIGVAVVDERDEIQCVAVRNPDRPIVLAPTTNVLAIELAMQAIIDSGTEALEITGELETARLAAEVLARRREKTAHLHIGLGLYRCTQMRTPEAVEGRLRVARADEAAFFIDWRQAFIAAIGDHPNLEDSQRWVPVMLTEGRLHAWEAPDGEIVSMASWAGPTPNGVRISLVYTPERLRGRGYASACVAALTVKMLTSGRRFVFLFTDLKNPVSNKIYQRIGYEWVGECGHFRVE